MLFVVDIIGADELINGFCDKRKVTDFLADFKDLSSEVGVLDLGHEVDVFVEDFSDPRLRDRYDVESLEQRALPLERERD